MKTMSSAEVRQTFLDFFEEMGHRPLASSSLVPADDPTLLFVNAGMVQFKDVFLGLDKRDYRRATTSQKCMRVSGKHNDLENVGPSPRHHTFFEMLGNFSFGDYFKRDAIKYAYRLLTEVYQLPADRLVFTVYENDDEAYSAWVKDLGVDPKRVARMGPDTNFWQMADTGPCGPTSEIHWDKLPQLGEDEIIPGLQAEDDRFLEIWNLVFMQFNRLQADPEHSGQWDEPLPAPGVDTGMGLERIVSIMQGVEANYETDLFTPIIRRTQELTGHSDAERDANIVPYRVIADHIRAAVFLISDGVYPGAKGRAAIPRIVIRRAARFGSKIGFDRPFLAAVADAVFAVMGEHFSELLEDAENIKRVITLEEERFHRTMDRGLNELENLFDGIPRITEGLPEKLVDRLLHESESLSGLDNLPTGSIATDISETVDQVLLNSNIGTDIRTQVGKAISESSTVNDVRVTVQEALRTSWEGTNSLQFINQAIGDSNFLGDIQSTLDDALLKSNVTRDVRQNIDEALRRSNVISSVQDTIDKALSRSNVISSIQETIDEALGRSNLIGSVQETINEGRGESNIFSSVQETIGKARGESNVFSSVQETIDEARRSVSPLLQRWDTDFRRSLNAKLLAGFSTVPEYIDREELSGMIDAESKTLYGDQAFYLKATLGLPFQVTKDVAEECGFTVDEAGFAAAEAEHARISGGGQAMGEIESGEFYRQLLADLQANGELGSGGVDYAPYSDAPVDTEVLALVRDGASVGSAIVGETVEVILAKTQFYAQAGGQVSDMGTIAGEGWAIDVVEMKRPLTGLIVHIGEVLEGNPAAGDRATASLDAARRQDIIRNHTATHLLHAALRNRLGNHVQQRGSLVAPGRLRFDFSHPEQVSSSELAQIAAEVNGAILANYRVSGEEKSLETARREGAMALFGEKYSDIVRTVIIGSGRDRYSYELCGGVHVAATAEIGSFVFTSEGSVSAGIRRVEALTGRAANAYLSQQLQTLAGIADHLGAAPDQAAQRIIGLQSELSAAQREIENLRRRQARLDFDLMINDQLESLNGLQALVTELDNTPMETMREMTDWFRNRVDKGVMVLASDLGGRPQIVVAVSDALVKDGFRAGDLIKPIAKVVGGGGGGRPQMAQAGGRDSSKISEALQKARELLAEH